MNLSKNLAGSARRWAGVVRAGRSGIAVAMRSDLVREEVRAQTTHVNAAIARAEKASEAMKVGGARGLP